MQNFVKCTSSNSQLSPHSTDEGDPYYPVPNPRNQELYAKYQVGKGLEKFLSPSESKLTLVSVKSSTAFLTLSRNLQVIIIIEPETSGSAFENIEQALAEKEPGVTFVGRLASYKYFNMDQVFNIEENFLLKILQHGSDVQLIKLFGYQDYYLMCVLQAILNALELFDGLVGSGKLKRKKR